VHAVGHLARDPEQLTRGGRPYTRLCLAANDYAVTDEEGSPQEVVTLVCLSAFGALGEVIAHNTRKGDQLIVQARIASHIDAHSERVEHTFVVTGFRFGAPGRASRETQDTDEGELAHEGTLP
jgi:single-stranded DNA-binding protein